MGPTSASGYIYPALWLQERYGKTIADLDNAVQSDSYTTSLSRLASGQADIMVSYGHIRTKYAADWKEKFGGTDDMVNQTGVIGVTEGIYNDMIAYSKNSDLMQDEDFRKALGDSFIEIADTDEGRDIISVFSQVGYELGRRCKLRRRTRCTGPLEILKLNVSRYAKSARHRQLPCLRIFAFAPK